MISSPIKDSQSVTPAIVAAQLTPPLTANVRLLALLSLSHVMVDAYASSVPALLPFWQERFALSYGLAGLITGIANVTSSIAQPLVGVITDRGRDPRWIAVSCLVAAVGVSSTGLAPNFGVFLACVVIGGLGVSGFHPQGYKLTGAHSGERAAVATSWFLVGGNVGVAVGPLLGTAIALRYGISATWLLFIPGALFALAMWVLVPKSIAQHAARHASNRKDSDARSAGSAVGEAVSVTPADLPSVGIDIRDLPINRRLLALVLLVLMVAVRSTITSALISFVPLYYVRIAGTGEEVASRVLAGMLFAGAVATIAGGYLADRFGRLRVLALSLVPVPPLLLVFLALPPASVEGSAALCAVGALLTGSFGITVVIAQELWHERRGLASGLIVGLAFGLGGLLVPLVGVAADLWGLGAALQLLAVLPGMALVLLLGVAAILAPTWRRTTAVGRTHD